MTSDPLFDNPDRTDLGGSAEDAVPEADALEQSRPEIPATLDPEAPADTAPSPRISDSVEANEADVIEQSLEVPLDDEPRED